MNQQLITRIPSVEQNELAYLQSLTANLSDDKMNQFIALYNAKRKKAETILICCLLGFVAAAGIQRFVLGHIAMGVLYFFTAGFCFIGTIIDLVNYKSLTLEYNKKAAIEAMGMVQGY